MVPDVVVADGQFHAEPHVGMDDRFIIQLPEYNPFLVIGIAQ